LNGNKKRIQIEKKKPQKKETKIFQGDAFFVCIMNPVSLVFFLSQFQND